MAQIDTNIYGLLGRGVKSVQDYDQEAQATEAAKLGNLLNRSKIDEYQTGVQEKNALRDYLSSGANLSTPEGQQGLYRVAPTQAGGILKDQAAMLKEGAQARASNATASASEWDLRLKKANTAISDIASLGSRDEAISSLQKHLQAGDLDEGKYQSVLQTIPQDPAQFPEWRKGMLMRILDAKTQLELSKPVIQTRNTGGSTDTLAIDPMTGAVKVTNTVKNTNSPDAVLSANTSRANNRDTIAVQRERLALDKAAPKGVVAPELGVVVDPGTGNATPITVGGSPVGPKPSEAQKKELMSINQQNSIIQGAIDAVKKTPGAFSFGRGAIKTLPGGESVAGRFETDNETQARAYVFNNVSKVINERAGAAQSAQELARLQSFLPGDTDNAKQIQNKLVAFQQYLADLEKGTRGTQGGTAPAASGDIHSQAEAIIKGGK